MLPYFHCFPNLASTLRIHLAHQAHLQTLSQNHKMLQISLQIFQACFKQKSGQVKTIRSSGGWPGLSGGVVPRAVHQAIHQAVEYHLGVDGLAAGG